MKTVLLTGANGFIATQVARNLVADKDLSIVALVRAIDNQAARAKLERKWWDYPELIEALNSRIQAIAADVSLPRFSLNEAQYLELAEKNYSHYSHCG